MDRTAFVSSLHHGNLFFDVMTCSAIGGASLGLFFFFLDAIAGQPLYTPMLLGSILFYGAEVGSISGIDLSTVAGYTFVHFAAFAVVGLVASLLAHYADFSDDPKPLVAIGILTIEVASFAMATFAFPGAIVALGAGRIGVANVFAAGCIGLYLTRYRRPYEARSAPVAN